MKTKIPYTSVVDNISVDIMVDSGLLILFPLWYRESEYEYEVYLIIIQEEIKEITEKVKEILSLVKESDILKLEFDTLEEEVEYKVSNEEIERLKKIDTIIKKVILDIKHNFSDSYHTSRLNELIWLASDGFLSSSLNVGTEEIFKYKNKNDLIKGMKYYLTALKTHTNDFISESAELLKLIENVKSLSEIRGRLEELKRVYKCLFFDILNILNDIEIINKLCPKLTTD